MATTNMGGIETAIRAVVGSLVMVFAAIAADLHPFVALGGALVATVVLATAIAGVCPLYTALGIDTHPEVRSQPRTEMKHGFAGQVR
jgi:Protein of unknown function (DUF2892)